MQDMNNQAKQMSLEKVIETAVTIPGVKVNRKEFLTGMFSSDERLQAILDKGTISVGIEENQLRLLSSKLIIKRTSESSIASFLAGIPGGLAMAATIPLDILQFFGMSLRLAQEISYLYGAEDLWLDGNVDSEKIKNQLLLYCGVMFGVSSAVSGVRVLSTQIAKTTLKKLPQKALTKTFWYPIVKEIGKAIGVKITKSTVAQGVSKAIPLVGGLISGTLNFASMMPMANRLRKTFEDAIFHYSDEDLSSDIDIIENINGEKEENDLDGSLKDKVSQGLKKSAIGVGGWFSQTKQIIQDKTFQKNEEQIESDKEEVFDSIKRLKELVDADIITLEEFEQKKSELLSRI